MRLTNEQKAAVFNDGDTTVIACPGSGKTTTLIARLLRCIETVESTPRKVACITYTNAAVNEIDYRIRKLGSGLKDESYDVSTIHSFCLSNILKNYYWLIEEYRGGFEVLPGDSNEFKSIVKDIGHKYGLDSFAQQGFEMLARELNGEAILPAQISPSAAAEFWSILQENGYIDFSGIIYYSYQLLKDYPFISKALAAKYAHILVDEFQDTTSLQTEILYLIHQYGITNIFIVGDPEQSIFGFSGARPELMHEFSKNISAVYVPLSGNYRSTSLIVEAAQRVINREPEMFAALDDWAFQIEPQYFEAESDFAAISDYFLPAVEELEIPYSDCAILAPQWYQLMPLGKQLRQYGVPVIGPGARLYKRSHILGRLVEPIAEYVSGPNTKLIAVIEKELFFVVNDLTGEPDYKIFSFFGRRVVIRFLMEAKRIAHEHQGAEDWLRESAIAYSNILVEEKLLTRKQADLLVESANDIIDEMRASKEIDLPNLTISEIGLFASSSDSVKLLTLHKAKGREFKAVAIIALQDGWVPFHNKYNQLTDRAEEEARRLFYVGVTRAQQLLMLFSRSGDYRPRTRFLNDLF